MAGETLKPLRRRAWILVAVLAVCAVGRGGYALYLVHSDQIVTTTGDAPSYLGPARMLAEHARFENVHGDEEYLRTPGYPLFIAAVYRVFGERNTAVLLVQVLLSACTVYLAYFLASRMWSSTVGLVAAVLTLLEPLQNATSATLLTETLAAFLLLAIATIGYHAFTSDRLRPGVWALLGFAITVSTFVRPVTYYLPPCVLLLLLVWSRRRRFPPVDLGKAVAAFLVPIVVLCGAWQVRNHHEVGSWRFSGVEAKNMYIFRAAGVVAREDGISLADAQDRLVESLGPVGTRRAGERYDQLYRAGVRIIREHPVAALRDAAHGLGSELFEVRVKVFDYLDFSPPEWLARIALAVLLAFVRVVRVRHLPGRARPAPSRRACPRARHRCVQPARLGRPRGVGRPGRTLPGAGHADPGALCRVRRLHVLHVAPKPSRETELRVRLRSSAGQSKSLLMTRSQVRVLPGALARQNRPFRAARKPRSLSDR